jgi:hypothetical protein
MKLWKPLALVSAIALFPSPHILSVSPSSPAASPTAQTITVTGTGFLPGLSLDITTPEGGVQNYKGGAIQSTRDMSFQVSALFATAGTYTLVVTNIDGGTSEPFPLKAGPVGDVPVIDRVTPDTVTRSGSAQSFRLDGKGFSNASLVTLTDPTGAGTMLGGTDVSNVTPTSMQLHLILGSTGDYSVTVSNPGGGPTSNAVKITVK